MKSKYKITGFARLLVFMVFFAPLAYLGASYYNGENGVENIKALFNRNVTVEDQIDQKKEKIKKLENEIQTLKSEIKNLEK